MGGHGAKVAVAAAILAVATAAWGEAPVFEDLGVPVTKAGLMGVLVGPGPEPGSERVYFNFRQEGGKLFVVAVDPETGASTQYQSPVGTGAWGFEVGPDGRIYLGTHEGPDPGDSGRILVLDPKGSEPVIEVVGQPAESESYLWMFAVSPDGILYACTYPNAKLVSYNPATGAMTDHGVMDAEQQYTRSIACDADGTVYLGVGYGRANVVAYDPATGTPRSILPDTYRSAPEQTVASVYRGVDGHVYIQATAVDVATDGSRATRQVVLRAKPDGAEEVADAPSAVSKVQFADGRTVTGATLDGDYTIVHPNSKTVAHRFTYEGAGSGIFMVSTGPLGRIYGGTWMPNQIFSYDPETGAMENPGNPTDVDGEIYSMLDHDGVLYVCAYPGSFLAKWNPAAPWDYGPEPGNNPRALGRLGPGHLRPRAMIHGPGQKIYIGSYPEYGRHGGALAIWDPELDTLVANYHHLIENQAIVSLVHDPETGLVFGGSSTSGGGGTEPIEPEAKFFAFDPEAGALVREHVPLAGAQSIRALVQVDRRIFGIAGGKNLFEYDIDQDAVVHVEPLPVDSVLDISLGLWTDGQLYGFSPNAVFRIDPATRRCEFLAEYDGTIRAGFAMDAHGIYFGDRAKLMRYRWPE